MKSFEPRERYFLKKILLQTVVRGLFFEGVAVGNGF